MVILNNPGRTAAFLVGAFIGVQAINMPNTYKTMLEIEHSSLERDVGALNDKIDPPWYNKLNPFDKQKYDKQTLETLKAEKEEQLKSVHSQLESFANASTIERVGIMVIHPSQTYTTLKHYNVGVDTSNLGGTGIGALAGGISMLGLYEFLIRRPSIRLFKRVFKRNKRPAE